MQATVVAVIIAVGLSLVGEIDAPARDRAQVLAFLRARGLERTPEGYEVDHIIRCVRVEPTTRKTCSCSPSCSTAKKHERICGCAGK